MLGHADSAIVLGWLNGAASQYKVFVSNRVTQIVSLVPAEQWRYVSSDDNPADCAWRGSTIKELLANILWWNGPPWLQLPPSDWPRRPDLVNYLSFVLLSCLSQVLRKSLTSSSPNTASMSV